MIALVCIIPLAAAAFSLLCKKPLWLAAIALIATSIECVVSVAVAYTVAAGGSVMLGAAFNIDALGALILLTVCIVGFFGALYSISYLRAEVEKGIIGFRRTRQYFTLMHLFLFAMLFATATTSPILMWIAIEATTLATAFLVSFYNKPSALEAAWKYLIINSVGLLLGFLGTLLFFTSITGSDGLVTWETLRLSAGNLNPTIAKLSFILVFIGYGTKIGLAPMHTWKPDAYSKAPTPIVALFSGALLNVAFLALLRFKIVADSALGKAFSQNLLMYFGLFSLLLAACIIFTQWNYKRLLAYSSIEHAGIMALGFAFGGIGTFAALLHSVYHSLAKSSLFFTSGNIFIKYSSTKIKNVRGMLTLLPLTTILFIAGFLAAAGVPPFGTFFTEMYIVTAGMSAHPVVATLTLAGLALAFVGFLRHTTDMVFGEAPKDIKVGEEGYWTLVPSIALLVLLLVTGIYLPATLKTLIDTAAQTL